MTLEKEIHRRREYVDRHYEEQQRQGKRYDDHRSSWPGRFEIQRGREIPGHSGSGGRDYKPRFDSRGDSPRGDMYRDAGSSRIDSGIAGLIFMCNKKTQRRCLAYNVLGMPVTKKRFADQIVPGMKLFLFEFESRELYGIFEAVSYVGMDLEPKAFIEADIDFPLQVRFRVLEKCLPLRESEYKDAILENYFESNRFKFDLSKEQVFRLLRLFRPADQRSSGPKSVFYPAHSTVGNTYSEFRGPTSSWTYRSEDHRRDDEWFEPPVSKAHYVEGSSRVEYPAYKDSAPIYRDAKEAAGQTSYAPHARYFESSSSAKFAPSQRPDADAWCNARPEDYDYADTLGPMPSAHQYGPSSQSGVSSAREPFGFSIKRPGAVAALTNDDERYWKADTSVLPMTEDYRSSLYARHGSSAYGDIGGFNGDRPFNMDPDEDSSYRLASKKALVSDADYLPPTMTTLAPPPPMPQVMVSGKAVTDFRDAVPTYNSDVRKASYGYPEDVTKQATRYSSMASGLASDVGHPVNTMSVPENDRYRKRESPVYSGAPLRHHQSDRDRSVEESRHYEYHQPPPSSYFTNVPEECARPKRASVWDRIAAPTRGPKVYNYERRRSEFSSELPEPEGGRYLNLELEPEDESFVVDFKRRNKLARTAAEDLQPRKKKIVRPDTTGS